MQRELKPEAMSAIQPASGGRTLTVVIPVLNEERGLDRLVARLTTELDKTGLAWDVVFVDDGSRDGTLAKIRDLNALDARYKAVAFSRNFGKEIALAAGLSYATGDAVVLMDADLQHPPEVIHDFIAKWGEGYDNVYAQRDDRANDTWARQLGARDFYWLFNKLSRVKLPEGAGDFRLLSRKAVDAMNKLGERVRFTKGLYAWIGFKSVGVPYHVPPRAEGPSRFNPRQLFRFALDGLVSFSTIPLRVWSVLGLSVTVFAFGYAAVFLIKTLIVGRDAPGFPTLVISIMLLSGVQLISLGVLGEYIGRMYEEVKGRPLYLVGEEIGVSRQSASNAPQKQSASS
jgi:glycosyltransferase involved in cell wall biosynthesis